MKPNWRVFKGNEASSLEERKKLFQNAVTRLLRWPGWDSVAMRPETGGSSEIANPQGSIENNTGASVPFVGTPGEPGMFINRSNQGQIELRIAGVSNRQCVIEVTTNLVDWSTWTNFLRADAVVRLIDPEAAKMKWRFYRLRTP